MDKIAIVYWSGTGNTEEMCKYVQEGAKSAGAEVDVFTADAFNASMVSQYTKIAFGCPSMGDEVLEEDIFEPMFTSVEKSLSGKPIGIFGSYGWGDGEWMRIWEQRCKDVGAVLVSEGVMANEAPNKNEAEDCRKLGTCLAKH